MPHFHKIKQVAELKLLKGDEIGQPFWVGENIHNFIYSQDFYKSSLL